MECSNVAAAVDFLFLKQIKNLIWQQDCNKSCFFPFCLQYFKMIWWIYKTHTEIILIASLWHHHGYFFSSSVLLQTCSRLFEWAPCWCDHHIKLGRLSVNNWCLYSFVHSECDNDGDLIDSPVWSGPLVSQPGRCLNNKVQKHMLICPHTASQLRNTN